MPAKGTSSRIACPDKGFPFEAKKKAHFSLLTSSFEDDISNLMKLLKVSNNNNIQNTTFIL
jgi:hypothetical protein